MADEERGAWSGERRAESVERCKQSYEKIVEVVVIVT
jgi:hypothetical protein